MAAENKETEKNQLFEGNSPVNKYNLLILEQSTKDLTEERILLAFQALDELVPKLGVFTRIFQKVREDLFEAVYSDELTGTAENHGCENHEYIQRLPYFSLVKQVYKERHKVADELREQLDTVMKRLFDKHKQLEETQGTVADKEDLICSLTTTIEELKSVTEDKEKQIEVLKDGLENAREDSRNKEYQMKCDIADLKESLEGAKNEINFLLQFKKGYDDVYYAFMDKRKILEDKPQKSRKSVISTTKSKLSSDVESAQKLEEQIFQMMNVAIEEYDKYLETHKSNVLERVVGDDLDTAELSIHELDQTDLELENVQEHFKTSVNKLMTELNLLQQHSTMLVKQLKNSKDTRGDVDKGKLSSPDSLIAEISEEIPDPFIPHERVFSKYAAMLYTSNNQGKTFEEFKEAKYCTSCGEKTVVCPHKVSGPDKIFVLPKNCSHIKLTRPTVRISKDFQNKDGKLQGSSSISAMIPATAKSNQSYTSGRIPKKANVSRSKAPLESLSLGENDDYVFVHSLQRIWDDYRQRTKINRPVPRPLDLGRTRSLMKQFLAYLLWTDEYVTDEKVNLSILDIFYWFMRDRYIAEDVVFMAAHDFLSAIITFSETDKMIQLIGHVFTGNLDASCLRYAMLMFDFISLVEWKEVEDFRAFSSVIYPFLCDEDLESLQMSYTSYSENRISGYHVSSFIIHIILKHKEPRFQDLESRLIQFQIEGRKQLNEREFREALDNLLPLCNELTRRRLFMQSERAVEWDGIVGAVPIKRLSQISGFLALQQVSAVVKETLVQRVYEWRERPRSVSAQKNASSAVLEMITSDNLLSMTCVKHLAANMNRQMKLREERKSYSLLEA